jgi:hypothetical protein
MRTARLLLLTSARDFAAQARTASAINILLGMCFVVAARMLQYNTIAAPIEQRDCRSPSQSSVTLQNRTS